MLLKKITISFFTIFGTCLVYAQCPPPGNVILAEQVDVVNFINNYGTCEVIDGDLRIGGTVTDISGLTAIRRVEGSLILKYADNTTVSNFANLEFVGGNFEIDQCQNIEIIEGIDKLHTVNGSFIISQNYGNLLQIRGFSALQNVGGSFQISRNRALTYFAEFNELLHIGGRFVFSDNRSLTTLQGFNKLIKIGNVFHISSYDGNLTIEDNRALVEVNGFNSLIEIVRNMDISQNESLTKLEGFASLEKINYGMNIEWCRLLTEIPDFDNLTTIGSGLEIWDTGLTHINGFNNIQLIGDINPSWGNLYIVGNDNLLEIKGFIKLDRLEGVLGIGGNGNLQNLSGFSNLVELRSLLIGDNDSLENLSGLENVFVLNAVGGTALSISGNSSLIDCSVLCNLLSNGTIIGIIHISDNPSKCSSEIEVREECIPDFDDDGILNDDDLDDDNDGILDTVEQNGDPNRDSDNDNYPDHQDLDSDNDGCFDVIEAGFTDGDLNGTLGNLPDTVDGNGVIVGSPDGYTAPLDLNSDGVFDFQQANTLSAGENGNLEMCINSGPVDLLNSLTGTPDVGGAWTPSLTSGTGVFDPSVDAAGVYTYTVNNGVCGVDTSEVDVSIDLLPNAGGSGSLGICINGGPVDLFDSLTGVPDTGGTWTPALTSGTGVFDPSSDAAGVYTYTVNNGVCGVDTSEVDVSIDLLPNAGGSGSLGICINGGPVDLFDSLTGVPDTGGTWTPALTSGTGVFDPSSDATGIYTYTVDNGVCGVDTSEVDVSIDLLPNAGGSGSLEICINGGPVDLFDSVTGTPDVGGAWTPSLTSGTGVFDPSVDAAGVYTYTVTNGQCVPDTSEVDVSIDLLPNAGGSGSLEICINGGPVDLFDGLTGTPNAGGTWTPALTSGTGVFDPSSDAAGVYTYTVNNGVCGVDTSEVEAIITDLTPISDYEIKIKEFSSNNSLEVVINSDLEYEFSLDGINYQSGNVFNNLIGGNYTIYVQEVKGCGILETTASILDYPKFFTPNADGYNDVWHLEGITNQNYLIYIFNRYGKLVKNLTSSDSNWDGTFNGSQLPTDDYWFKVVFVDGVVKSGHFTLKR